MVNSAGTVRETKALAKKFVRYKKVLYNLDNHYLNYFEDEL